MTISRSELRTRRHSEGDSHDTGHGLAIAEPVALNPLRTPYPSYPASSSHPLYPPYPVILRLPSYPRVKYAFAGPHSGPRQEWILR